MSTNHAYHVRPLTPDDLPGVARVHLLAFPESALTLLGAEAVLRYYDWQLTGPHNVVALCISENEKLTAFCFGGTFRGALGGFLRKNRAYLLLCITRRPWLLAKSAIRRQITAAIRSLVRPPTSAQRITAGTDGSRTRSFGVLAIAVDPNNMGTGQGKYLMQCLEQSARMTQFSEMHLTVSPDNRKAIDFYERLGWTRRPGTGRLWTGAMVRTFC